MDLKYQIKCKKYKAYKRRLHLANIDLVKDKHWSQPLIRQEKKSSNFKIYYKRF